mmetsp:Transcript_1573/g.3425  ORF Transcript_1573/g.3425 Transcript_1573/m.3425 type:complete len:252 (-) Transcript_1573:84-839(-)
MAATSRVSAMSFGSPSVTNKTALLIVGLCQSPPGISMLALVSLSISSAFRSGGANFVSPGDKLIVWTLLIKSVSSSVRGQMTSSMSSNRIMPRRTSGKCSSVASCPMKPLARWKVPLSMKETTRSISASCPCPPAFVGCTGWRAKQKEAELSKHTTRSRGAFRHCPNFTVTDGEVCISATATFASCAGVCATAFCGGGSGMVCTGASFSAFGTCAGVTVVLRLSAWHMQMRPSKRQAAPSMIAMRHSVSML